MNTQESRADMGEGKQDPCTRLDCHHMAFTLTARLAEARTLLGIFYQKQNTKMKLKTLLESIHESHELSMAEELKRACELIIRVQDMDGGERDTLRAAWEHGPIFDGDVPSKSSRDKLVSEGYIAKVVVKGQDGYNACTYIGQRAYRLIEAGA